MRIISRARGTRSSRTRSRACASSASAGSKRYASRCMLTPSTRQDSSAPVTSVRPSGSASTASRCPPTVSWSVSAMTSRPAAAALATSSAGVSVPSEAVEWVCRSMRTTRDSGARGRTGDRSRITAAHRALAARRSPRPCRPPLPVASRSPSPTAPPPPVAAASRGGRAAGGLSAPQGTRSTSPPASRRSVRTSSSYIRSPDCSGHRIAQSQSPRASCSKTARSSGAFLTCQSGVGRLGGVDLGVGGGVDVQMGAGVQSLDPPRTGRRGRRPAPRRPAAAPPIPPRGPGPEQATALARPPLRSSPAASDAGEQPTHGERPGHPDGDPGTVHHDAERFDARRDDRLQRLDRAVRGALPGVGEETGRPDPATALRATGFAPHNPPPSSPPDVPSRTITRPQRGSDRGK